MTFFFQVLFLFKEHFRLKIEHRNEKVIYKKPERWFSVSFISHFWVSRLSSEFPLHELAPPGRCQELARDTETLPPGAELLEVTTICSLQTHHNADS